MTVTIVKKPAVLIKKPVVPPPEGWTSVASASWTAPKDDSATATPKPAAKVVKVKTLKKAKPKRAKEQSLIAFPYMDLDTAITVARAFVENGGGPRTRDQLAGALSQSPLSGAFIMKLSAARQFGLVDFADGKFKLTDLGFSIVDKNESRERAAKVQAFLNVELYRRIYEDFKGKQLPPRPHGLEQTFVQMGVTQKQKTNARLAFDKSARQAGFSTLDPDRLIEPILGGVSSVGAAGVIAPKASSPTSFAGGGGGFSLDPLIAGLLDRLPPSGESWPTDKRKKWLQTFEANLEMIYPAEEQKKDDLSLLKKTD